MKEDRNIGRQNKEEREGSGGGEGDEERGGKDNQDSGG